MLPGHIHHSNTLPGGDDEVAAAMTLLTGDLVFSGRRGEYEELERFLSALRRRLRATHLDADPLVLPVPGNHDLARPTDRSLRRELTVVRRYREIDDEGVRDLHAQLWRERDPGPVGALFNEYSSWFARSVRPDWERRGLDAHLSFFPGDWSVRVPVSPGFALGVVGLNSAWMQHTSGSFEGRLELPTEQLQAALPEDEGGPLSFFETCDRSLLLLHHPPEWLSPSALRTFKRDVFTRRFDACLHGHMHAARPSYAGLAQGNARVFFQGSSLFGLSRWGDGGRGGRRRLGYASGELERDGRIRVWPRVMVTLQDGAGAFDADQQWGPRDGEDAIELRAADPDGADRRAAAPPPRLSRKLPRDEEDAYCSWARQRYERTVGCVEELARRHRGRTVLVVAHGGVLNGLFYRAVGLPLSEPRRFSLFNAAINRFMIAGGDWRLDTWGDVAHLGAMSTLDDN